MSTLKRTAISYGPGWCSTVALAAFGVNVRDKVRFPDEVEVEINKAGFATRSMDMALCFDDGDYSKGLTYPTLTRFIREHPTGDWLVYTTGHVMALRSGLLTDTDVDAGGRRRVWRALKVTR